MNSKYILALSLSAILLMSALIITVPTADALKGKGKSNQKTNYKGVCGDRLCSEIPSEEEAVEVAEEETAEEETAEEETAEEEMKPAHAWLTKSGTLTSVQDPGVGHESHQLAIILPPSDKPYTGILSYAASENIQLVALTGPLADGEDNGQPIWSPDGKTKFALTFVDPENSMGTWAFSGNALAVHTMNTESFTVSYSVTAAQ